MADQIANQCFMMLSEHGEGYTGGQLFDSLDFNVVLKSDNCQNIGKMVKREVWPFFHFIRIA